MASAHSTRCQLKAKSMEYWISNKVIKASFKGLQYLNINVKEPQEEGGMWGEEDNCRHRTAVWERGANC